MEAKLESVTATAVRSTRFKLNELGEAEASRLRASKSGVVATFLARTAHHATLSECEVVDEPASPYFETLLSLTLWGPRLIAVKLALPSACCGSELVPDLRHAEHFCPSCSWRYPLPVATEAALWRWEGLADRRTTEGELVSGLETLESWLMLRAVGDPLEQVLLARALEESLLAAARGFRPLQAVAAQEALSKLDHFMRLSLEHREPE